MLVGYRCKSIVLSSGNQLYKKAMEVFYVVDYTNLFGYVMNLAK